MAEDKTIRFRVEADDTAFNEKMRQIQQKMRSFDQSRQYQSRVQQVTQGGNNFSDSAKRAFEREQTQYQQQLRKDDQFMSQQIQKKERHLDNILKKKGMIATIDKNESDLSDKEIKRLEVKKKLVEQIGDLHRRQADTRNRFGGGGGDGQGGGGTGTTSHGMFGKGGTGGFSGLMNMLGAAAIGRGALNLASAGTQEYATRERVTLGGQAAGLNYGSRGMREFSQGRGMEANIWAGERASGAGVGLREMERQRTADMVRAGGGAAVGGAIGGYGGMAAGAMLGGKLGLMAGPIGGAVGVMAGGVAGGLAGMAGGAALGAGERGRAMAFDPERYQAMLMQQGTGSAAAAEAGFMARDPKKQIASQSFLKNIDRNAALSRRLGGMDDVELFGDKNNKLNKGWLRNQMGAGNELGGKGLEEGVVLRELDSILSAGGSTESGKSGAGRAAAMNRQFNVKNIGSVMGKISGAGAGANEDEATKRLLTEAVRLGVDLSKMPVEMERMINVTASLATAGGGFSKIDASLFGTVGDVSKSGIEGGKTAFDIQKNKAKAGGGLEGQMGYGFFLGEAGKKAFGEKAAKKISGDADLMNRLNQLSAGDLEKDPAELLGTAEKLGITPKELLEGMRKKDSFKQLRTQDTQEAAEELGRLTHELSPENLKSFIETGSIPGMPDESKRLRGAYSTFKGKLTSTEGESYSKLGQSAQRSRAFQTAREAGRSAGVGSADQLPGLDEMQTASIDEQSRKEKTGIGAEDAKDARSKGSAFALEALAGHIDDFGKASEAVSGEMNALQGVFADIKKSMLENGDADFSAPMKIITERLTEMAEKLAEERAESGGSDAAIGATTE